MKMAFRLFIILSVVALYFADISLAQEDPSRKIIKYVDVRLLFWLKYGFVHPNARLTS